MKRSKNKTRWYILSAIVLAVVILFFVFKNDATQSFTEAGIFAPEIASIGDLPNLDQFKARNEELRRPGSTRIPILVYHSVRPYTIFDSKLVKRFVVPPSVFDAQLAYIQSEGYTPVSLEVVAKHFTDKTKLPDKPIVLTFDDGWKNQYTNALPILQKYGMKGTFFIFTDGPGGHSFVSWEQVASLAAMGMEIGDHTETHPYLFKITDQKKLNTEIITSKETLEKKLGFSIKVFATPFSKTSEAIEKTAKAAGYIAARTESYGFYQSDDTLNLTGLEAPNTLAKLKELLSI